MARLIGCECRSLYAREGYFSRAAAYWNQAWELTRGSDDRKVRVLADYALGESIDQMVKFGQVAKLEARLKEIEGRDVRGPAGTKVADGWEGLRTLTQHHETALFSGPEALKMYLTVKPIANNDAAIKAISQYHPSMEGTSMTELRDLAAKTGLQLSIWRASAFDRLPIPSIIHLRSQHFSAVVEYRDGKYRLRDPGLGGDVWLSEAALRDEATGFVLAPEKPEGGDWRTASDGEGQSVVGHCTPGKPSSDEPPPDQPKCGGGGPGSDPPGGPPGGGPPNGDRPKKCPPGMPYYGFHPAAAGLVIDDVPVSYDPPVGPQIHLRLSYNHRSYKVPSTFGYGNVGPLWTFNALSYIIDNGWMTLPPYDATVAYLRGHGREYYTPAETVNPLSGATLVQISHNPANYERRLPDGTVEVYDLADRAASLAERRIFLTSVTDPRGHTIEYAYDSSFRVVAVTDALGQVTTFEYENTSDPDLLTKVTDPFGRFATIGYDGGGRVNSITDAAGMTSTFAYGDSDFINAMTTPYGTTTFRHEPGNTSATFRVIEATDPVGGRERLEFVLYDATLPATQSSADVPTGFSASNASFDYWNSFYWDKLAMATHPGDRSYAVNYTWMLGSDSAYGHAMTRSVPHTMKRPLESRVWFRYPAHTSSHNLNYSGIQPSMIGRVLEGGVSEVTQVSYNSKFNPTSSTDPLGRQRTYTYATNGLDLLEVRQVVSGGTDLLQSFSGYNSAHLPATATDGSLQDTDFTYNSFGQPLTVINAKSETTTFTYETTTQNLLSIAGPVSGANTTLTYDAIGHVESIETSDGYIVEFDYDALGRVIASAYPDATTETFTYDRLDLTEVKDRLGRITRHFYDAYGRRIATRDPAGRTISYAWCKCGVLDALVDAKGQRTTWEHDINGRITREMRADGTTDTLYTYDLAGRLKTVTDPTDQVTTYTYNLDGSLASAGFTNETIATPDTSHTYDTYYPRPATMVDGNGTTTYSYVAAGTNGAGQLASVNGPFTNDTISYTYDELGRVLTRMLNGTGAEITYDALGRPSQLEFPIGALDYTYVGHTGRRASVTYPNDQTTAYSYLDDEHDFRLQTIHHKNPSAATLSKFDYTYDTVGNILTWRQDRAGSAAKIYTFTHDLVDQLTSAVLTDTNTTPTLLKRQAWAYDASGNRTVDQTDDEVFATTHDNMNRLGSRAPGGPIVFSGSLNEAGTVTIDGKPATVDASNNFRGTAQLTGATTTVTLKAKDASGNETTNQYEVDTSGGTTTYTYDANGNLTSDGTMTYFWNALNQLVEVKQGTTTLATFEYDGAGRRTEKVADGITRTYIYDAEDIVEERLSGSTTDTIRYYHGAGIDEPLARKNSANAVTYYLADHLGSIVQETNAAGAATLEREYDSWGSPTSGGESGYSFQGREWDTEIDLYFFRARYFSPSMARFISDDPIGLSGGTNLVSFVANHPNVASDPFGLTESRGTDYRPATGLLSNFVNGLAVGIVGAGLVVAGAAAAGAAGVSTAIITGVIGAAGAIGGALTAASIYKDVQNRNYEGAAFSAGTIVGGTVTAAGTVTKIPGVNTGNPWTIGTEKVYNPKLGPISGWLGTGPDKASGTAAAALATAGAATAGKAAVSCNK